MNTIWGSMVASLAIPLATREPCTTWSKVCTICGEVFEPCNAAQLLCSNACVRENTRRRKVALKERKMRDGTLNTIPLRTLTCAFCGAPFTSTHNNVKSCGKVCADRLRAAKARSVRRGTDYQYEIDTFNAALRNGAKSWPREKICQTTAINAGNN